MSAVAGHMIVVALRSISRTMRVTPRRGHSGTSSVPQTGSPTLPGALGTLFGDRVAIILPQRPQTGIAHVAIYQMGAVALPLSHLFGPEALEYRLGDAGAHVAIVDETTLPKLLEIRDRLPALRHIIGVDIDPAVAAAHGIRDWHAVLEHASPRYTPVDTAADDPAMIIYTSGTTGNPKGALMAHRTLIGNLSGFVCSRFLPATGRPVLVPCGLGMDRRSLRRAAAGLAFRPAAAWLQGTFRSREGIPVDREVWCEECLPSRRR